MLKGYPKEILKTTFDRFIGIENNAEQENKPFYYEFHYSGNSGRMAIAKVDKETYHTIEEKNAFLDYSFFDWLDKEEKELRFPEKKEEIYK